MKNLKKYLILFALAIFAVAISGCYGRPEPVHVLNIKAYRDNGFVNADSLWRHRKVKFPKEVAATHELPGSRQGVKVRVFIASPLRLQKMESTTGAGRIGLAYDPRMEENKFILELHNPELVPGLPPELAPDTIATLRYVGTYVDSFSKWDTDSVDKGVNTLRLVVNARGCRQANGSVLNPDWICSDIVSKSIMKVQDGQRIPRVP